MILETFLTKLTSEPLNVEFDETLAVIDIGYDYTPTGFKNGDIENAAGSNEGSCKILAFGAINDLTEAQTLACFGRFYREDVLQNPGGEDHANIRNFMKYGWAGVRFEAEALVLKLSS